MRKCLGHQMIKDLPPFHFDRTSPLILGVLGIYSVANKVRISGPGSGSGPFGHMRSGSGPVWAIKVRN